MESSGDKNDVPVQSTVATSEIEKAVESKGVESSSNAASGSITGTKVYIYIFISIKK